MTLPYDLTTLDLAGETMLNIEFRTRAANQLVGAGHVAAKAQLPVSSPALPALTIANAAAVNTPAALPVIDNSNSNRLRVSGPAFAIDFDKATGFLCGYTVEGIPMLEAGQNIHPIFWRAGTDNDFGANVNNLWAAWRNPEMRLSSLDATMRNGSPWSPPATPCPASNPTCA